MGYMHINNLYKMPSILECYALEKIHGTSAHIKYKAGNLTFYAGGCKQEEFENLFDKEALKEKFEGKFQTPPDNEEKPWLMNQEIEVIIYGEAFGGKMQGMSATYGKQLRFMAFDVKINDRWKSVDVATGIVQYLGLEFVPYERGPLDLKWLDEQRDRPSRVAVVPDKIAEGIVIRPIYEMEFEGGGRFIIKHKRAEFRETKTQREVDPDKALILTEANAIAEEWVTPMRMEHVMQRVPLNDMSDIGKFVPAMVEDVQRESDGEFEWSNEIGKAIGRKSAALAKEFFNQKLTIIRASDEKFQEALQHTND